ncbi:Hypothetical protein A7982_07647 [Minicystis rosea]|nr:Hypothetical protein A7982_07647 [Minicystis rosea]
MVRASLRDRPFLALALAATRAVGPPALLRAVPPFAAIGLASAIVFGGYGMRPRDLVMLIDVSTSARCWLWAAWILITVPAARALVATPEAFVLRTLPAPLWWFFAIHGAHLLALQLPWMVLFATGAGPFAALAAGCAAAAAVTFVVARPRAIIELAAAAMLALSIVLGAPRGVLFGAAITTGTVAVAAAFRRAPERAAAAGNAWIAGSPPMALALAHAAVLVRRDAVTLTRGVLVTLLGALVAALAARNNGVTDREGMETIALAAGAIPLAVAAGGVGPRVLETERRLTWLLLSCASSVRLRALVAAGLTAAWGALMGTVHGVAAALALTDGLEQRARLIALGTVLGASIGSIAAHLSRRAAGPTGVDGTVVVVGMTAAAASVTALAAWLGAVSLFVLAAAGAALVVATVPVLARRERLTEQAVAIAWEDA